MKEAKAMFLCCSLFSLTNLRTEERPWGSYEILHEHEDYKIKRIVVKPGQRLSLQRHTKRAEHWIIIQGSGIATLNDERIPVTKGSTIHVQLHDIHRIENTGDQELVFVEVQTGTYFGEDDIERLQDDYGRIEK